MREFVLGTVMIIFSAIGAISVRHLVTDRPTLVFLFTLSILIIIGGFLLQVYALVNLKKKMNEIDRKMQELLLKK